MCERLSDTDGFVVSEESYEYLKKTMFGFCGQLQKDFYVYESGDIPEIIVFINKDL